MRSALRPPPPQALEQIGQRRFDLAKLRFQNLRHYLQAIDQVAPLRLGRGQKIVQRLQCRLQQRAGLRLDQRQHLDGDAFATGRRNGGRPLPQLAKQLG